MKLKEIKATLEKSVYSASEFVLKNKLKIDFIHAMNEQRYMESNAERMKSIIQKLML